MKETHNEEIEKKNINVKLFPFYKMISWDLLFFYAIIFLYLVQVKNIPAPRVILSEALYNVAIMIFIIPSGKIVDKIGKKNEKVGGLMTLDLCKGWTFRKEGGTPVPVDLPHDAMLTEPRDGGCRNGVNSGYFPGGKYFYEKQLELPPEAAEKSVVLHFEGVYQNCSIYVGDALAGRHRYGYTAFDVDISGLVKPGSNILRVEVDNSLEPNCRWYSGSGIYRPVQLLIREKEHISQVHLETVDIHPAKIRVEAETTADMAVSVEIWDGETCVASGAPGILEIRPAE